MQKIWNIGFIKMTSIKFDTIPSIALIEKLLITFSISSLLSFLLYFCECIYIKIFYDINIHTEFGGLIVYILNTIVLSYVMWELFFTKSLNKIK